jgi:hypothetical protein
MAGATDVATTYLLPAPLALRSESDVTFYEVQLSSDSAVATAFKNDGSPVAKAEAELQDSGQFRIRCTRDGTEVAITFAVDREYDGPAIDGDIDGEHFRVAGESGSGGFALTDSQKRVLQPWNAAGESLIVLGEAAAIHTPTDSVLGCIAAGLGTGVATLACLDGALPACAAGLYGAAYLADHCI